MRWINRLERKFSRFGIPNLMLYITGAMLVLYVLHEFAGSPILYYLTFDRAAILSGQVWRLVTFIFVPTTGSIISTVISLYFYYFIGSTLENTWGESRFTLYYLLGMVGLIISGFLTGWVSNHFLNLSLFFAFAHLFPNHQVLLFFVIPVKIKYLAYLNWAYFLISFIMGPFAHIRLSVAFSVLNFIVYFGPEVFQNASARIKAYKRRREWKKDIERNRDRWR